MKVISIVLFSFIIFSIFLFLSILFVPVIFGYQHQSIGFLALFLIIFTIPIILYIINKKNKINIFSIIIYFLISGLINIFFSIYIQEIIIFDYDINILDSLFESIFDGFIIFIYSIFLLIQLPIIFSSLVIRNILNNKYLNIKQYFYDPYLYLIIISIILLLLSLNFL